MKKVFDHDKEQEAKAIVMTSLVLAFTLPSIDYGTHSPTKVLPVSSDRVQPSVGVVGEEV